MSFLLKILDVMEIMQIKCIFCWNVQLKIKTTLTTVFAFWPITSKLLKKIFLWFLKVFALCWKQSSCPIQVVSKCMKNSIGVLSGWNDLKSTNLSLSTDWEFPLWKQQHYRIAAPPGPAVTPELLAEARVARSALAVTREEAACAQSI